MNNKRIAAALIALIMSLAVLPFGALAGAIAPSDTVSGACGPNLTWVLNTATGAMNITGTGEMYDYASGSETPWLDQRNGITTLTVGQGVTSIGSYAFHRNDRRPVARGGRL